MGMSKHAQQSMRWTLRQTQGKLLETAATWHAARFASNISGFEFSLLPSLAHIRKWLSKPRYFNSFLTPLLEQTMYQRFIYFKGNRLIL